MMTLILIHKTSVTFLVKLLEHKLFLNFAYGQRPVNIYILMYQKFTSTLIPTSCKVPSLTPIKVYVNIS